MAMKDNSHLEVISVRFTKRIRNLIDKVAKARGSDVSSVIRQAVHQELARLSFLTDEEKKALGLG
jgi:predicted transcriptional regulator